MLPLHCSANTAIHGGGRLKRARVRAPALIYPQIPQYTLIYHIMRYYFILFIPQCTVGSTGSPSKPQTPMVVLRYLKASAQRLEEARGKFAALAGFVALVV